MLSFRFCQKAFSFFILFLSLTAPAFAENFYELFDEVMALSGRNYREILVKPDQIPPLALGQLAYFMEDEVVRVGVIRKLMDRDTVKIRWKRKDGQGPVLWRPTARLPLKQLARQVNHEYHGKTVFVPAYHHYLKVGEVTAVFENNEVEIDYGAHRPRSYYSLREISPTQPFPEEGRPVIMRLPGQLFEGRAIRWFKNDLVEVEWEKENGRPFCPFTFSPFAYLSDPFEHHFISRSRLEFIQLN